MDIDILMHESMIEEESNPNAFFKKYQTHIDPILYQAQLEEYQRQYGLVQIVSTSTLGENNLPHNP